MGKVIIGVIVVVFALLIWLGWASWYYTVDEGVVVDRDYHPAYTTTTMIQSGKTTIPSTTYHPERWTITVKGKHTRSDDIIEDAWDVSERQYERTKIGDKVNADDY